MPYFKAVCNLTAAFLLVTVGQAQDHTSMLPQSPEEAGASTPAAAGLAPCAPLPKGDLSDEELQRMVPEGSPGKVRIRWKTESQEENYGFNIMRAEKVEGPYAKVNPAIIPGEGSTNIPKEYCFEDTTVQRGEVYFYFIESISTAGVKETVEGTKDTQVKVKTVGEERAWLKARATGQTPAPTAPAAETSGTLRAADAPTTTSASN